VERCKNSIPGLGLVLCAALRPTKSSPHGAGRWGMGWQSNGAAVPAVFGSSGVEGEEEI